MEFALLEYFLDPVLRAPTYGTMLMCLVSALSGCIVILRKESLIGESLSHASYPGVILSLMIFEMYFSQYSEDKVLPLLVLLGAGLSCLIGYYAICSLQRYWNVSQDASLCFILSTFFGLGLTCISGLQLEYPLILKKMQAYLFGQAATMTDINVLIYLVFCLFVLMVFALFHRVIKIATFDPQFAKTVGISVSKTNLLLFLTIVLSVVIGIRSVGVVLMSAMLILPPMSARFLTYSFEGLLGFSALFGITAGFLGIVLSNELSCMIMAQTKGQFGAVPTGPSIVLVSATIFILCALFAPEKGVINRFCRKLKYRTQCQLENVLKTIWKLSAHQEANRCTLQQLTRAQTISYGHLYFILQLLKRKKWAYILDGKEGQICLTPEGIAAAQNIIRLHRLWELYLVRMCGQAKDRVHMSAEEMEHVLTPELEQELTQVLSHPTQDPHQQPIPPLT